MLPISIKAPANKIKYGESVLLAGSCFTEHLGNKLQELKFNVLQNPNGILFDPFSVADSLNSYMDGRQYKPEDLFEWNEVWHSWLHHSAYSDVDRSASLEKINASKIRAHNFLKEAGWLIITLGSSFSYRLTEGAPFLQGSGPHREVSNCHRAPAQWFKKRLMPVEETAAILDEMIHRLQQFNNGTRIIFTISPVRHIRDGVVENNRSKARLIEAVHALTDKYEHIHYFPAYEIVIDVLRDYRYYDIDMVHPNYQATAYVWELFSRHFIQEETRNIMEEVGKLVTARKHQAFHPDTAAHRQFLMHQLEKAKQLEKQHPFLDLRDEIRYFSTAI